MSEKTCYQHSKEVSVEQNLVSLGESCRAGEDQLEEVRRGRVRPRERAALDVSDSQEVGHNPFGVSYQTSAY